MVDPRVYPPKANVELADVVRRFGPQYVSQHGHRMMPSQKKALSDIAACCTPELGGRLYHCDDCDQTFWHYHCCRNRACPKCHGSQAREWLQERQAELLPCDYWTKRLRRGMGGAGWVVAQDGRDLAVERVGCDTLGFPAVVAGDLWPPRTKGYHDVRTEKPSDPGHAARRAG